MTAKITANRGLSPGFSGEHPEVVVPGRRDSSKACDREENAGESEADLSPVAVESSPVRRAREGEAGEGEEDDADADPDGGVDRSVHFRITSI
jgi:hypothetical protein